MDNEKTLPVDLTKSQVENLIEFIKWNFIDIVLKDEDIDNINYIIDMMEALKKLRATFERFNETPIKEQDRDNSATKAIVNGYEIIGGFIKEEKTNENH